MTILQLLAAGTVVGVSLLLWAVGESRIALGVMVVSIVVAAIWVLW